MKEITMVLFDNKHFMKMAHELHGVIVGMDVFELKDNMATQISPGVLSPEEEGKLISGVYDRLPTELELDMAEEIVKNRGLYALDKTVQYVENVGGITLLSMTEVGGRYFAYTTHDNLKFNRLAEIILTSEGLPPDIGEVPKELLPAVIEHLSPNMLPEKNKGMTIQIGEGIFLRLRRQASTMFCTVIVLEAENDVVKSIKAPLGFAMGLKQDGWHTLAEDPEFTPKMHEEMQKAFDHVTIELSMAQERP